MEAMPADLDEGGISLAQLQAPVASSSSSLKMAQAPAAQPKSSGGFFSALKGMFTSSAPKEEKVLKSKKSFYERERQLSLEEVDSDDLDGEMNLSDCEDFSQQRSTNKQKKAKKRQMKGGPIESNKYHAEVDTNVFEVSMACLKEGAELATGDPVKCIACQAVFNKNSVIKKNLVDEDEDQEWPCEFCNYKNEVNIDEEEVPKSLEVNYLVEASAQVVDKKLELQPVKIFLSFSASTFQAQCA